MCIKTSFSGNSLHTHQLRLTLGLPKASNDPRTLTTYYYVTVTSGLRGGRSHKRGLFLLPRRRAASWRKGSAAHARTWHHYRRVRRKPLLCSHRTAQGYQGKVNLRDKRRGRRKGCLQGNFIQNQSCACRVRVDISETVAKISTHTAHISLKHLYARLTQTSLVLTPWIVCVKCV